MFMTFQQTDSGSSTFLPRSVQEHLGQQLRSAYNELQEKPAYLGDPALPVQFDEPLYRLSLRERVRQKGIAAVRSALQEYLFAAYLRQH